jgi:hypothetical protein
MYRGEITMSDDTTRGLKDYAAIADFDPNVDRLQLHGVAADYQLGTSPIASITGTAIFWQTADRNELIGVAQLPGSIHSPKKMGNNAHPVGLNFQL